MNTNAEVAYPFVDQDLARRLERAEASANVGFVEARGRLFPESGAAWIEVAGAYAMFDGVASPLTQTFGLGMFEEATPADLSRLESFFLDRGAPVFHEVSPLAGLKLVGLLNERRYRPMEFTSVMFRPVEGGIPDTDLRNERIRVRIAGLDDAEVWAQTAARGWSTELPGLDGFMLELGRINAERTNGVALLAELDGQPVAAGGLSVSDGVALMSGASTVPEARRQGAQRALLEARLLYAAEQGCDLVMMCALPGSASQRNAERQGFRIAYTRIKWQLVR